MRVEVKIHAKKVSIIIGHCIWLVIMLAIIIYDVVSIIIGDNDFSQIKTYLLWFTLIFCFVLFIYQLWQLLSYKMIVSDKEIILSANKAFFQTLGAEAVIKYNGLKSVKYLNGLAADYGKDIAGKINILQFEYGDGTIIDAKVNRFSDKQIEYILTLIKEICKKYYSIEL